jgi:hypothetical protein
MAGVPFDAVERLATIATAAAARNLLRKRERLADVKAAVERLLSDPQNGLAADVGRAFGKALRTSHLPNIEAADLPEDLIEYISAASDAAAAEVQLQDALTAEMDQARALLFESARAYLPRYLVFGSGEVQQLLADLTSSPSEPLQPRNSRAAQRERPLLLYLQRVAAKNDTFSEFGPSSWGRVDADARGVVLSPATAVARREPFLERWTAHAIAAGMNSDPEVRAEIAPRNNPNGVLDGGAFVFAETGEAISLHHDTREAVSRCDGRTPAHSLGIAVDELEALERQDLIRWRIDVPALQPHAFDLLVQDVGQWRDNGVRARWTGILAAMIDAKNTFRTASAPQRLAVMNELRAQFERLGATRKSSERMLYSATNPIGEECFRESGFSVSEAMTDQFTTGAAPWVDLWRDTYAFVASRVAAGLRGLLATAPKQNGAVMLPAFLRHAETQRLPLTGPGMVAMAHIAFQEVKAAFRAQLASREDAAEWQLTVDDCHVVRNNFDYPKFDEYTYPSADLQISAHSVEAACRGEYEWVISEFHPPLALLQHCFYWSCPDHQELSQALRSTVFGRPSFHFGFFAADFTTHTTVRQFEAMPELTNFVAPERPDPTWRSVAPADAEVYADNTGDVCLRVRKTGEHLGSFARAWLIPLGFHPFHFGRSPHMPRLRCGNVVVQRRSWTVSRDELGGGDFSGVSRELVIAVEKLRAEKDWPRFIYIRPTEKALRRSGAEGRDKDTKPVYIDLESYLFVEVFQRWLTKAGELEVTEMLPDPNHLLWQEHDGRRTFEMRTQIVPRT